MHLITILTDLAEVAALRFTQRMAQSSITRNINAAEPAAQTAIVTRHCEIAE